MITKKRVFKMVRKTIEQKKVAIIKMFIEKMNETLKEMNTDLDGQTGETLTAFLEAHFEKLRCDSGNLNQVLEENRMVLDLFFEGIEQTS